MASVISDKGPRVCRDALETQVIITNMSTRAKNQNENVTTQREPFRFDVKHGLLETPQNALPDY